MALKTYTGSCHCGAVRYEADLDLDEGSIRCNCSICARVRAWFTFAKGAERFRLRGADALTEYRWTPPGREHPFLTYAFCGTCGVRMFARSQSPSAGETFHAVAIPTLELEPQQRAAIPVRYVDGRNDRFDQQPAGDLAAI